MLPHKTTYIVPVSIRFHRVYPTTGFLHFLHHGVGGESKIFVIATLQILVAHPFRHGDVQKQNLINQMYTSL